MDKVKINTNLGLKKPLISAFNAGKYATHRKGLIRRYNIELETSGTRNIFLLEKIVSFFKLGAVYLSHGNYDHEKAFKIVATTWEDILRKEKENL